MNETRTRSFIKGLLWRLVATTNSYIILKMGFSEEALVNAIIMNITGFGFYYSFERICDRIKVGRQYEN